jgi:hypothetical protein
VSGPSGAVVLARVLRLEQGRAWTATVAVPRTASPRIMRAELFEPGSDAPFRSVHIWTNLAR